MKKTRPKIGIKVTVYKDPITEQIPEGEALLVRCIQNFPDGMDFWYVNFPDGKFQRWINTKGKNFR